MSSLEHRPIAVASDLDGVYTETGAVFEPYLRHYAEALVRLHGTEHTWQRWGFRLRDAVVAVRAAPQLHGWRYGQFVVAPATSDPYVEVRAAATWLCDRFTLFGSTEERDVWQEGVFNAFESRPVPMKPAAPEVLSWLADQESFIVSNSSTDPVCGRLQELVADLSCGEDVGRHAQSMAIARLLAEERVVGGAKKYLVDAMLHVVEAELRVPGLDRPVLLHRPHYYAVLVERLQAAGASWRDLLVIGDIFELDLALPLAMGAQVILVDNGSAAPWERTYLTHHPRARIVTNIADIPALVP